MLGVFFPQNGVFPELFPTGRQVTADTQSLYCVHGINERLVEYHLHQCRCRKGGGGVQTAPVSNVISLRDVIVRPLLRKGVNIVFPIIE